MRNSYTSEFKTKVALEAVKGEPSLSELGSKYKVHPNQIWHWRNAVLVGLPEVFSEKRHRKEQDEVLLKDYGHLFAAPESLSE